MTENEIIKGFEDFINRFCGDVSSLSVSDRILLQDAFRLVLRQKRELDRLNKESSLDNKIQNAEQRTDNLNPEIHTQENER